MQRKLLRPYLAVHVQAFVAEARADLAQLHHENQRELAVVREEVDELRQIMRDVTATLREQADHDVKTLRKQLEMALIKLTPRDGRPLN